MLTPYGGITDPGEGAGPVDLRTLPVSTSGVVDPVDERPPPIGVE